MTVNSIEVGTEKVFVNVFDSDMAAIFVKMCGHSNATYADLGLTVDENAKRRDFIEQLQAAQA